MNAWKPAVLVGISAFAAACAPSEGDGGIRFSTDAGQPAGEAACIKMSELMAGRWPDPSTRLETARFHAADRTTSMPEHCELVGTMQQRRGTDGQDYAIRFHLRMPTRWNQRFLMQGGGGSNGELGDAIGQVGAGTSGLAQGYAVLSQDSGHDNARNTIPERGGMTAFGLDPEARANFGGRSLPFVVDAARAAVASYYGQKPRFSYFFGCSKGGQEGMYLAHNHPDMFDGIVASAPGMSLPRTALATAWNTQGFTAIIRERGQEPTLERLSATFSNEQLALVKGAILRACDSDDGVTDGIIGAYRTCTSDKVVPQLRAQICPAHGGSDCLSEGQIAALERVHDGVKDTAGKEIYPGYPWDAGWAEPGWRMWMIGAANGSIPSINAAMGAHALGLIFTTPPSIPAPGPEGGLHFADTFDVLGRASEIYATSATFPRSAWTDVGARSPDLRRFAKLGGKMIVAHGVSDSAFSFVDTSNWFDEANTVLGGRAAQTVRVFPVPGMNHCRGGAATAEFDTLASLVSWVEHQQAPASIIATAGANAPWPGRTRPLCPYPKIARYVGGDKELATSFECR